MIKSKKLGKRKTSAERNSKALIPNFNIITPTCTGYHMSGSGKVLTTHDVTERLSWEAIVGNRTVVVEENWSHNPAAFDVP